MKINVSSILRSTDSSMDIAGEVVVPQIDYIGQSIRANSPVKVSATVLNTGDHLLIDGTISGVLLVKCSRCLEDFEYNLETSFEEELSNKEESVDVIHFEGDVLDITDIVVSNIMLSLPMRFVCSEDCRGLCPKCGKNLNVHECSCSDETPDPRLAVLKDLLKGN